MNNFIVLRNTNVQRIGSDISQLMLVANNLLTDDSARNIDQLVSYIVTSKHPSTPTPTPLVTKIIKVKLCSIAETIDNDPFVYLHIKVMVRQHDGREIIGSVEFSISYEGNLTAIVR